MRRPDHKKRSEYQPQEKQELHDGGSNTSIMKLLLLLRLLLLGAYCCASILGPIESLQEEEDEKARPQEAKRVPAAGDAITTAVHDLLNKHQRGINDRLKVIETFVSRKCQDSGGLEKNAKASDIESTLSTILDRYVGQMAILTKAMTDDLKHELREGARLVSKMLQEHLDTLATKSDLREAELRACGHKVSVGSKVPAVPGQDAAMTLPQHLPSVATMTLPQHLPSVATMTLPQHLPSVATWKHLDERLASVNRRLDDITKLLGNVSSAEVLEYTRKTFKSLDVLQPVYDTLTKVMDKCQLQEGSYRQLQRLEELLQQLMHEVDENGGALTSMTLALEDTENTLVEKLEALQEATLHLNNNMAATAPPSIQQPPTSTPTTTPPGTMGPCLDSEFVGAVSALNLCKAALRYDKCFLGIVAYHCCRTCTDAGRIPDVGLHRYLRYPRRVNLLLGR